MLLKLSPHISECLEHARLSRELALNAADPILKDDFLQIEQHWLRLAESYRTAERLQAFIEDAHRWQKDPQPSDAEIESLAERMVDSSKSKL